jgi:hypothetical protein
LFDAWFTGQFAEMNQDPVLQWGKTSFTDHLGGLGRTDLVKPPRDGSGYAVPRRIRICVGEWIGFHLTDHMA